MTAGAGQIGIIGVGHLGALLIRGLLRHGMDPKRVTVCPRGNAAALAGELGLELAGSNAEVIDRCNTVLLAVRVDDALKALSDPDLPWREGQLLLSACAGVRVENLASSIPDGVQIFRFMPLSSADIGASPTALFPARSDVAELLTAFGPVQPVQTEDAFETATVFASMYGWVHRIVDLSSQWGQANGLPRDTADRLAALTVLSAGRNVAEREERIETLLTHLATPGGITEHGLGVLEDHGLGSAWFQAASSVLAKLHGTAPASDDGLNAFDGAI